MSSTFRRFAKSKVGTAIVGIIGLLILVGFAMGDIQGIISGGGFGGGSDTLAKVGSQSITERETRSAVDRRLAQLRTQNPNVDPASMVGEFDQILDALIDARTLEVFAGKFGFILSKKLVDAQIAQIPGAKGLNGQFTDEAYRGWLQQQRLTDEEVRMAIRNEMLQQMLLTPAAASARAPVGMATPYAAMLLEGRAGDVAFVPFDAFKNGLTPTPADLQTYYSQNKARYMVPEQRVLRVAAIGQEQVAGISATDKEIADYYNANQATYGAKDIRVISQVVTPDQAAAQGVANRAKGGQAFAAAAAPAGFSAADISVGPQTKQQFTELAGAQVANAAFGAAQGAVIGPIRSEFGWHVVKIDQVRREGGKSLEGAKAEIATKLNTDKRKARIDELADQVQTAIDDGASFSEAVAQAKLQVIETPPLTVAGASISNPGYKPTPVVTAALKSGFELAENDEPVVDSLPGDGGSVVVSVARVIAAAPAPLARVSSRVRADWTNAEAGKRARQLGSSIEAKVNKGASMADAAKGSPVNVIVRPVSGRRIQLSQYQGRVPPPLQMLFSLTQGKTRLVGGSENEGFYVVKLTKIVPGNALSQPGLVSQTQQQMQRTLGQEYALQFISAMQQSVGVKRNDKAIAAAKQRLTGAGS
jgi:peptidyl-prolyl cis-trans isomerase D